MTVSELISYLNKLRPNAVVRAVDNNGNSTSYVMLRELTDNSVEITGLPEYGNYHGKGEFNEYDDRVYMPGPCNGDFFED